MNKKTRIAGGTLLLVIFFSLAGSACAPATPISASEVVSLAGPESPPPDFPEDFEPDIPTQAQLEFENEATATPEPPSPPKPPATMEVVATAHKALTLGDLRTVAEAGFSFRPVIGYDLHLKTDQATLVNPKGTIILSMTGVKVDSVGPLEDRLDLLLHGVGEGMEAFNSGSTYPVQVGQKDGLAADITGQMKGEKVTGQVVMVAASKARLFYFVALVVEKPGWEQEVAEGDQAIEAIIDTVTFADPDIQ